MKLTREEVLHVAELAHLELSEADAETYRGQLDSILEYVGKLDELDLTGVEPMAQALFTPDDPSQSALRDDVVLPCDTGEAILNQAPAARKPYFRVPKVIDR
jgi:aspartyl-tRNA(Asn)/glutamyl-tRNA(Gln) amidotransferase subunit C